MIDEAMLRRIIREELDNYDRDKGITPRMSRDGIRAGQRKWGMACACGPGQCANLQASGVPCPGFSP